MATTQEVDILLKTVADTSGAHQVQNALQQTQQAATITQQSMTRDPARDPANLALRAMMAQQAQTLENFNRARESIVKSYGVQPTLLPRDFGIQATQATAAARTTAVAVEEVGHSASLTGNEVLRLGAAFVGAGIGLSAFTAAGRLAHDFFAQLITDGIVAQQAQRDNAVTLGQSAQAYQDWAQTVSQQAHVSQTALLQAGTAAEQFGRLIGFGPAQTAAIEGVALTLSRLQGNDFGSTMTQLTQAMNGNEQAANALNLQLDAAYVAYTQLGGATADVFNGLDATAQATLRYQSVLQQLPAQLRAPIGPISDLSKAQQSLNSEWNAFVQTYGPGVIGALSVILEGAAKAGAAIAALDAMTRQRNATGNATDEGFKNELALLQRLQEINSKTGADLLGPGLQQLGQTLAEINAQPGAEVIGNMVRPLTESAQAGQSLVEMLTQADAAGTDVVQTVANLDVALETAARYQAEATAQAARHQSQVSAIAEFAAREAAALQNEYAAQEAIVRLKGENLQLTAQQAQIQLDMLDSTERLAEAQNRANQAQLQAQMQALPASRALQDLNNQMALQRSIAENANLPLAVREQAASTGFGLLRQQPGLETADILARIGATPAERAAQDAANAARLQQLQQQAVLQPYDFAKQQNDLLSQIAQAAKDSAQRAVNVSVQAINLILRGGVGELTPDDYQTIVNTSGKAIADAILQQVKGLTLSTSPQLAGAGGG